MRLEKSVELVQHHAGGDADDAPLRIEFQDLPVVPREIHDEAVAQRAAAQARARAAWRHREGGAECGLDGGAGLLGRLGKSHGGGHDLIGGGIRGIKLAREIIERDFTFHRVQCRHL